MTEGKKSISLFQRFKILIRSILIVIIFMLGYKANDLIRNRTFFLKGQPNNEANEHNVIDVTDPISSAIINNNANPIVPIPRGARVSSSPPRLDTVVIVNNYNTTDTIYMVDSIFITLVDTMFISSQSYKDTVYKNHEVTTYDTISISNNTISHSQGVSTKVFKLSTRTDNEKELFKYGVGLNASKNSITPNVSVLTRKNKEFNLGYDFVNKTAVVGYKHWWSIKKKR